MLGGISSHVILTHDAETVAPHLTPGGCLGSFGRMYDFILVVGLVTELIITASYKMELSQYISSYSPKCTYLTIVPDPDQPDFVSPWTKETIDDVLRVLLGCFAGLLLFTQIPASD